MSKASVLLDKMLLPYSPLLGKDLERYRNHVHRVFANCIALDQHSDNEEKYAISAVFHDIGIWTAHTFDYLEPSIREVELYLLKNGKPAWLPEIKAMIYWHHKVSSYKSDYQTTVEVFRKADWIDVTFGIRSFGLDRGRSTAVRKEFPNKGFHLFLLKLSVKNFFRHPLNPVPVFKR